MQITSNIQECRDNFYSTTAFGAACIRPTAGGIKLRRKLLTVKQ